MKLIDLFEQHSELTPKQIKWLNAVVLGKWEYNNGMVNVEGTVNTSHLHLVGIPVQFGYVSKNFRISNNMLSSLKGSPKEVGGIFWARSNFLTSLEGAPREVGGNFYANDNNFKSEPDHSFITIGGNFHWKTNETN